jgi:hypothetical protein
MPGPPRPAPMRSRDVMHGERRRRMPHLLGRVRFGRSSGSRFAPFGRPAPARPGPGMRRVPIAGLVRHSAVMAPLTGPVQRPRCGPRGRAFQSSGASGVRGGGPRKEGLLPDPSPSPRKGPWSPVTGRGGASTSGVPGKRVLAACARTAGAPHRGWRSRFRGTVVAGRPRGAGRYPGAAQKKLCGSMSTARRSVAGRRSGATQAAISGCRATPFGAVTRRRTR